MKSILHGRVKLLKKAYVHPSDRLSIKCPIDHTPLIAEMQYDFACYFCNTCEATYSYGMRDQQSLIKQAQRYVNRLKENLEIGIVQLKKVSRIESIILTAKKNGII